MKITTTTEVDLPYYCQGGIHYYIVYSEADCLQVCDSDSGPTIGVAHAGLAFAHITPVKITVEEFDVAFNRVLDRIQRIRLGL